MIRVVHILGSLPPMKCGVGDSMREISFHMAKKGVDTHIITSENVDEISGVTVHKIMKSWSLFSIFKFFKTLRKIKPDVVHFQFPSLGYKLGLLPYFLPIAINIFSQTKIFQTWHEPPLRSPFSVSTFQFFKRKLFSFRYIPLSLSRSSFIFVEKNITDQISILIKFLIKGKDKFYVPVTSNIPKSNLIKTTKHHYIPQTKVNSKINVCYFGYIYPHKGIIEFLKLMSTSDNCGTLITSLDDSQYSTEIKNFLNENLDIKNRVKITGFIDAKLVADTIYQSDMLILPFRTGLSEKNGSYWAGRVQGTPILTTHKSVRGYDSKTNTFFCSPDNFSQLREGYNFLLKKRYLRLPHQDNTWDQVATSYLNAYDEIDA